MILLHRGGEVQKIEDANFHFPRFLLPVIEPCQTTWVEEQDTVRIRPPVFKHKEFIYITTIDDESVYKELTDDEV